ncbi:MAG: Smr/MutS family protein [Candidatus Krumholzibacteria bacterium]|jgi:dsDNA-specific endonuclease/ATPase MutS2|nr:Smr/MutS family protein [Candidatus Krumholzibacteria bacterium]
MPDDHDAPAPEQPPDDPVAMPIDGVLDLHMFRPKEVRELVPEYLDLCRERGILSVRVIHGKGIGVQRELVHEILRRHPAVVSFGHPGDGGSWGATVVELAPLGAAADAPAPETPGKPPGKPPGKEP